MWVRKTIVDTVQVIFYHYFDESLIDTLVKHVPINVGVKNDYRYGFFNLVLNRRLFLFPLILSESCCFCFHLLAISRLIFIYLFIYSNAKAHI